MVERRWWQPPRLRTDEEEHRERRVSWLELFYDLVFVVVIAEVSHYLSDHVSITGVLGYILLFMAVWWVWIGGTYYTERYETEDVSYRLLTFLQIAAVASLAVFAHDGVGETSIGFALSYAAARVLITFMWWRGGLHNPSSRPMTNMFVVGFGASIVLFVASVWVPLPWRLGLWGVGLFLDLVTPAFTISAQARLPRFSTSRLPERFGLFVIIVLGEAIVGVVRGVAALPVSWHTGLVGLLGIAGAFCLWEVYFDFIARRRARPGIGWMFTWSYLHLPLVIAIAAIGAALQNVIAAEDRVLTADVRWLVCGAVALALVVLGLLELTLRPTPDEPTHLATSVSLKFGAAAIALGLAAGGGALNAPIVLSGLVGLTLAQTIYAHVVWFRPRPAESLDTSMPLDAARETSEA